MAVKGLYITCREWDSDIFVPPFTVNEDTRYVMGPNWVMTRYKPVPFGDFEKSVKLLDPEWRLTYRDMHDFDYDKSEEVCFDSRFQHFLVNGAFVRVRKDSVKGLDAAHTLLIAGMPDCVLSAAQFLELPHPFDKALYPYKKMFVPDETIEVLSDNFRNNS